MIIKTQAIVLRVIPFSETSCVVLWLTRDHGKIATIIKGAHRRRSPFIGQVDLFYTCELLFYLRAFRGLHIVKECAPVKMRTALRTRWRAAACASYFTDLAAQTSPFFAPHPELFGTLNMALDYFSEEVSLEPGLFWFELQLMKIAGLEPQLKKCVICRRAIQQNNLGAHQPSRHSGPDAVKREPGTATVFSCEKGGVLCKACAAMNAGIASSKREDIRIAIAPDVLGLLSFWQSSSSWRSAQIAKYTPRQIRDLEKVMGLFMQYHLEIGNPGRALALSILRTRITP